MSTRKLIDTFEQWRQSGRSMVLATVYETIGSTYSKAGHEVLIAAGGDYQGLVSGGCLEGDLAEHAERVVLSKRAVAVTYDLRDEADDLWGLGVGCNGLIRVVLQPLSADTGFEPYATISRLSADQGVACVATVVASERAGVPMGATIVRRHDGRIEYAGFQLSTDELGQLWEPRGPTPHAHCIRVGDDLTILLAPIRRVPRLLVLGAGLDAVPVVRLALELGWHTTLADHRPAYLEREEFRIADESVLVDPRELAAQLPLARFDAVLVMSHHLETDREYLRHLAEVDNPYLGVLGPRARKARLLSGIDVGARLGSRLKGPVGLDIGADSPESIALSVLAELHLCVLRRD